MKVVVCNMASIWFRTERSENFEASVYITHIIKTAAVHKRCKRSRRLAVRDEDTGLSLCPYIFEGIIFCLFHCAYRPCLQTQYRTWIGVNFVKSDEVNTKNLFKSEGQIMA